MAMRANIESTKGKYHTRKGEKKMLNYTERADLIKKIDESVSWSDVELEEYEKLCESLGLNYHDYDDPDMLFSAIVEAQAKSE